jgi:hypothetical protein
MKLVIDYESYVNAHWGRDKPEYTIALSFTEHTSIDHLPIPPALALAHELGHVNTATFEENYDHYKNQTKRCRLECLAWLWAVSHVQSDQIDIPVIRDCLTSYRVDQDIIQSILDYAKICKEGEE